MATLKRSRPKKWRDYDDCVTVAIEDRIHRGPAIARESKTCIFWQQKRNLQFMMDGGGVDLRIHNQVDL